MQTHKTILFFLLCVAVGICSFGCNDELLPEPVADTDTASSVTSGGTIIPQNLTATHGLKRKVMLSWSAVPKAGRYDIYRADTPYSAYVQIAETTATSYTVTGMKAGATGYYRIKAVLYSKEESGFSETVCGTTLAEPFVSSIEPAETNGDSTVCVSWWMSNVSADTYQKQVRYTVTCNDSTGKTVDQKTVDGSVQTETSTVFDNLSANTGYRFSVEAYLVSAQNDTESSGFIDAATARRLQPAKPVNLTATQGISAEKVEISWELPDFVDVAVGNGVYEQKPLYFAVRRRILSADGTSGENWTELCAYFGSDNTRGDVLPNGYTPGEQVTWTDTAATGLKRGVQYQYEVQSYADIETRVISSAQSAAQTDGWLIAVPEFSVASIKSTKNEDESAVIETVLQLACTWEMFGLDNRYAFLLEETRTLLEGDGGEACEPDVTLFSSLAELNSWTRTFNLRDGTAVQDRGYYTYTLYVYPAGAADPKASAYISVRGNQTVLVTDSVAIPTIENLVWSDGRRDAFRISWTYNNTCSYELSWISAVYNGSWETGTERHITDLSAVITPETADGSIIQVEDPAASGEARVYTLKATQSVSVSETSEPLQTLGTPQPVFSGAGYRSMTVSWEPVQKAALYRVAYEYEYDGTVLPDNLKTVSTEDNAGDLPLTGVLGETEIEAAAITAEPADGWVKNTDGTISYTFSKPAGFHDARIAGRPIRISVYAENTVDGDVIQTAGTADGRVTGPALTGVTATKALADSYITVKWNAVPGAPGYFIKRDRCSSGQAEVESTDVYYVSADASLITANNQETDSGRVSVSLRDSVYCLSDTYAKIPAEGASSWHSSQDKIAWGVPFRYTVLPAVSATDTFDAVTGEVRGSDGTVAYAQLAAVSDTGSALGYGLNVTATKSESPDRIVITWDKPYIPDSLNPSPSLWCAVSGSGNWEKTSVLPDADGDKFVFKPEDGKATYPYDFAVSYKTASATAPHQSYIDNLATQMSPESPGEALNKGYAFAISCSAQNVPENGAVGFGERISWTVWDFAQRAIGPKADAVYTVQIKNNDYAADWQPVATVTADGTVTVNRNDAYGVDISVSGNSLTVIPSDRTDAAVHTGLLRVLRDWRHFAHVAITRTNSEGDEIAASCGSSDVYTYRAITDAEFAKAAMLAFTYPFYIGAGGDENLSKQDVYVKQEATVPDGQGGQFYNSSGAFVWSPMGKFEHTFSFTGYAPAMLSPGGEKVRFLKLSASGGHFLRKGENEGFLRFLNPDTVTVTVVPYTAGFDCYAGTLSLVCGDPDSLTVKVTRSGGTEKTIASVSSYDDVHRWFPMRFHRDSAWFLNNSDFGWW